MRKRDNKKIRGDIFEEFCVLYLKHVKNYEQVWRLEDVPEEILLKLSLKRRDMGIDILCMNNDLFTAVQCKYKKHTSSRKHSVSWKELSTFYALCMRSGPWEKYIVMTNCEYANHMGKKTEKDLSICIGTFRGISKDDWIKMSGITGQTLSNLVLPDLVLPDTKETNINIPVLTEKEKLRALRLAYYDKK